MAGKYFLKKTKSILLSYFSVRTSSLIADCFSRDFGNISFLFKGFYNAKKYAGFPLQIGEVIEVVFVDMHADENNIEKRGGYIVNDVDVLFVPRFCGMGEFIIFEHFLEFLKLIKTVNTNEHNSVFRLYMSFCDVVFRKFGLLRKLFLLYLCELIGLRVLGFFSDIFLCSKCGRKSIGKVFLDENKKEFLCDSCYLGRGIFIPERLSILLRNVYLRNFKPTDLIRIVNEQNITSEDVLLLKKIVMLCGSEVFTGKFKADFFIRNVEDKVLNYSE